jgi:hypothetical protein
LFIFSVTYEILYLAAKQVVTNVGFSYSCCIAFSSEIRSNVSAKPAYQNEVKNNLPACVVGISFVIDVILLGYAIQHE